MMLVVNKMRRCAGGNTAATQAIIRDDLRKVVAPFSPEDLRTSFVDAEAVLDARLETDPDVTRILLKKSGFASFTNGLDGFVHERGIASRYTTPLYTIEQVLHEALGATPSGDVDVDGLKELWVQKRHALLDARGELRRSIDNHVQRATVTIRKDGRQIADLIHAKCDSEDVNQQLRDADIRTEQKVEALTNEVQRIVTHHETHVNQGMARIEDSQFAKELLSRLRSRVNVGDLGVPSNAKDNVRSASDGMSRFGKFLVKNSFNPTSGSFGEVLKLRGHSGTAAHEAIKRVGHLFGKSFRPWEAVKAARLVANVGRGFAAAGVLLSVGLQIKEDLDARKMDAELRESRAAVRAHFLEVAHVVEKQFDDATDAYISQSIGRQMEAIDQRLEELDEIQQTSNDLIQRLKQALNDVRILIREMHSDVPKAR